MRRRLRFGLALLCLLAAVAALAGLVVLRLGRPLYYSDGVGLVRADALADRPMQVFERPTPRFEVPGPVRGRFAVLPDGRLLYGLARSAERTELVSFDPRLPDSAPVPLAIGAGSHEFSPCLDERGELWFCSDREGGAGGFDIWRAASLGEGRFAAPTPLPATVNTPADEVDPALAPDGTTLVFARRVPDETRTRLHVVALDADLPARALWPDDEREPFARLSRALDREPAFARDGAWLFFVRETAEAGKRVFGVPRLGARFDRPLEEPVLGDGGRFHAPSPLGDGEGFTVQLLGEGERPLLYAARARLLRPWWEGQRALERLLLWGLGLALLLLALLLLGARWRALDIVTWCILVSLLVHVLLWWLLEDVLMGLREPEARGEGERIAITLIDGETAAAAAAAASGDRSAQAWRAERADRAEAASVSAPAAALASASSLPAAGADLVELARTEPTPQDLATADAAASLQDAPMRPRRAAATTRSPRASSGSPPPARSRARRTTPRAVSRRGTRGGITVTAPGTGGLPKDGPQTTAAALASEALLARAGPAPSAAALGEPPRCPGRRGSQRPARARGRAARARGSGDRREPRPARDSRRTRRAPRRRRGSRRGGDRRERSRGCRASGERARAPAVEPIVELRPAAPVASAARRRADAGLRDALVATPGPVTRPERAGAALSALAPGAARPLAPTARDALLWPDRSQRRAPPTKYPRRHRSPSPPPCPPRARRPKPDWRSRARPSRRRRRPDRCGAGQRSPTRSRRPPMDSLPARRARRRTARPNRGRPLRPSPRWRRAPRSCRARRAARRASPRHRTRLCQRRRAACRRRRAARRTDPKARRPHRPRRA